MRARWCRQCNAYVEARSRHLDICPGCSGPLKGPPEQVTAARERGALATPQEGGPSVQRTAGLPADFIDGPRTNDDDLIDEELYR